MRLAEAAEGRSGFRTGQVAGNYRLLGLLGEGGMGEVYEAVHLAIDRKFAIKLLRPMYCGDGQASSRFEREARIVGALECEQIVGVFDYGKLEDSTPYLVMERLRGDDLKSVLKVAGKLSLERTVSLALDVCRGLDVAHRAGLIHRDLKPANLFLCRRRGGEICCKILDFGIAREAGATTSAAANVIGTARYMAPEQILNGGKVTPATDLYALGAIIYECLSGRRLHDGDGIESVLFSVIHDEPKPLGDLTPGLPVRLVEIVHRLLSKRAEERFQDVLEVSDALRAFAPKAERLTSDELAADFTSPTEDAELELTGGPVSFAAAATDRGPWLRALGAVLAVASVGTAGYFWGSSSGQQRARPAGDSLPVTSACPALVLATSEVVPSVAAPASAVLAPKKPEMPRKSNALRVRPATVPLARAANAVSDAELFVGQSPYRNAPEPARPGEP